MNESRAPGAPAVLASHPPLFGFAFSMSLIGYTFGFWPGAALAVAASMTGAGVAFLSVRVSSPPPPPGPFRKAGR